MTDKTTQGDQNKATPITQPTWTVTAADGTPGGTPTADDHLLLSRAQSLLATSADLSHAQRTAPLGAFHETALWLRLVYAPLLARAEQK